MSLWRLGVSQPSGSRHHKVRGAAGLIFPIRRKGWTYCRRDEAALVAVADRIREI
ncbi:MAG: hypothetical protein AAGC53_09140 [Actinomycetota bacterium]